MSEVHERKSHVSRAQSTNTAKSAAAGIIRQRESSSSKNKAEDELGSRFLAGLTIAGSATSCLQAVFSLTYVDVFLRGYELPLNVFANGSLVFSIVNTANDLLGAWAVDNIALTSSRSEIIGVSGCIFAVCFLTPFFRWGRRKATISGRADFAHFVTSMCLYDTMFSFNSILMGSIVTDNHTMSDRDRVRFMASGKIVNLVVSFLVARIALAVFQTDDMYRFRIFIVLLVLMACCMFVIAQIMMNPELKWRKVKLSRSDYDDDNNDDNNSSNVPATNSTKSMKKLHFRRAIYKVLSHKNFRAWIGMEMLLECHINFMSTFLKTFVDRLLFDAGVSRDNCDWFISLIRPLTQIAGILCYLPVRRLGYPKVYKIMFYINMILSFGCLVLGSPSSTSLIVGFIVVNSVLTGAVMDAGFHLAMSDIVLEMKNDHALQQRFDEPSLAGLFMGANTLLCKPMDGLLPILAAHYLETDFSSVEVSSERTRWVLFYLLLIPPLVFSVLQLFSWSRYDLHPQRTRKMRENLRRLKSKSESNFMIL